MTNKPNLFIVGAPKCGTSAMYEYLAEHPQVSMCTIKEPNFFDTDLIYKSKRLTHDEYNQLFTANNNTKIIGEASPWYLYSKSAANNIYQFNPEAKIIILLRNPIDMMYALHSELLYQGCENEVDFEKALSLESDRKLGIVKHDFSNPHESVYYHDLVTYLPQLERYFSIFGKENVKVIIFDELKNDASKVYKDVLQFLGLNTDFEINTEVVNPNKTYKFDFFRKLIMLPNNSIKSLVKIILPNQQLRIKVAQFILKSNTKIEKRKPLEIGFINKLKPIFQSDIEKLEQILNKDLSNWK